MHRTCLPPRLPTRHLPALLVLLLLLSGTAAALHELPVRVSVGQGATVSVDPLGPMLRHTLDDALGAPAAAPAPAPGVAPAQEEPVDPAPQAAAPAAFAWMPWALAAAGLLALLLVVALAARAARRRRKAAPARRDADPCRQELDLARMCSEAAILRATHLAARNEELKRELATLRAASATA